MDNALSAAKELYYVAKDDAAFRATLRTAYKAAVSAGFLVKGGMDMIVNASKNGSTMTMIQGLSEGDRIRAMRFALKWVDDGCMPVSGRALGRF